MRDIEAAAKIVNEAGNLDYMELSIAAKAYYILTRLGRKATIQHLTCDCPIRLVGQTGRIGESGDIPAKDAPCGTGLPSFRDFLPERRWKPPSLDPYFEVRLYRSSSEVGGIVEQVKQLAQKPGC